MQLYFGNINFYLQNLLNGKFNYESKDKKSRIVATHDLQVEKCHIEGLSENQNQQLKHHLQEFVYEIFDSLDFFNPDQLGITLLDYVEYVQQARLENENNDKNNII
jgi:predicted RNA-binding protein Jag